MDGLEAALARIALTGIEAEVWIDGSFLTEDPRPQDVDLLVCISSQAYDEADHERRQQMDWIRGDECRRDFYCDGYMLPLYPESHALHHLNKHNTHSWAAQFGFSRGNERKGIAVVSLP